MTAPARVAAVPSQKPPHSAIDWIRRNVPVRDVARDLGLDVKGFSARCWRTDNHRNGDGDPSIRFRVEKNFWRCFVCDDRARSVFDLVMERLACDFGQALDWISERYTVPPTAQGKHLKQRESWPSHYRVGVSSDPLERMIRTGLWSTLTNSQKAILPVLLAFRDTDTGLAEISYCGVTEFANVSTASVARANRRFSKLGFLSVTPGTKRGALHTANRYGFDFENDTFLRLMNHVHRQKRAKIEAERALRAKKRADRSLFLETTAAYAEADPHRQEAITCIGKPILFPGESEAQFLTLSSKGRNLVSAPSATTLPAKRADAPCPEEQQFRRKFRALAGRNGRNGDGRRAHLESAIFRKRVVAAYFDCGRLSGVEALREAIHQAALDLTSNRAVELRYVSPEQLRDAAFEKLQPHIQTFAAIGDYSKREGVVVQAVVRAVVDAALVALEMLRRGVALK